MSYRKSWTSFGKPKRNQKIGESVVISGHLARAYTVGYYIGTGKLAFV
jgi:hypothetical protein